MITPFSGISLIIHSLIIWSSKLFTHFRGEHRFESSITTTAQKSAAPAMFRVWFDVFLSLFFINVILGFILVSFFFALKSGIQDSMNQPHVRYIQGKYEELRAAEETFAYEGLFDDTFYYQK